MLLQDSHHQIACYVKSSQLSDALSTWSNFFLFDTPLPPSLPPSILRMETTPSLCDTLLSPCLSHATTHQMQMVEGPGRSCTQRGTDLTLHYSGPVLRKSREDSGRTPQLGGPPLETNVRETELSVQTDLLQVYCVPTPQTHGCVWWPQGGRVSAGGCGRLCFSSCVPPPFSRASSCP